MKILVVDDHALVREGLCQVLLGLSEQSEVLQAANCQQAFDLSAQHADIDLVLLDYHLPDMNGLDALKVFGKNHPELPIVMLSGSVNPKVMRQVLDHGAVGFVTKSSQTQELLGAIRQVLAGDIYLPPELLLAGQFDNTPEPAPTVAPANSSLVLTPRQEEVLYLLLEGRSNRDIGLSLELSEETVKNHVTRIFRCFGVQTRTQAVLAASSYGYTKSTP